MAESNPFENPNYGVEPGEQANPFSNPDYGKETDGPLARGWKKSKQSIAISRDLTTGDVDSAAQNIAEADRYARENPSMPEGRELSQAWDRGEGISGGIKEVAGEFKKDWDEANGFVGGFRATGRNLRAMGESVIEQTPNMVAPVTGMLAGGFTGAKIGGAAGSVVPGVGTAAGATVGGLAGGWAGASAGNAAIEGGYMAQEALNKAGIDPQDTQAVRKFLLERGDSIMGDAAVKGGIIGAVDVATLKLGSLLLNGPGRAATSRALTDMGVDASNKAAVKAAMETPQFAQRIANDAAYQASRTGAQNVARNVGAAALDPAGEFAGEYLGQGVATGDWNAKNAALEAFSSVGQSGLMYAGQKAYQYATRPRIGDQPPATDTPPAGPQGFTPTAERPIINEAALNRAGIFPPAPAPIINERALTPVTPSQRMGLDPAAGPVSAAAALAVDTGASPIAQAAPNVDPETGEIVEADARVPEQELATETPEQIRERLAFVEQQARVNGGWDRRTVEERDRLQAELAKFEPAGDQFRDATKMVQSAADQSGAVTEMVAPVESFDVSGRTPEQLNYLAANGQPGWKEAAQAEIARRQGAQNGRVATGTDASVAADRSQEAGDDVQRGAGAAPDAADGGPGRAVQPAGAVVAGGQPVEPVADQGARSDAVSIKDVLAKQITDMSDGELRQAIDHYGPSNKRTVKLLKEVQRRAQGAAPDMPVTAQQPAESPEGWDGMTFEQRTAILTRKGGWATAKGGLNVIGKKIARDPWAKINPTTKATIERLMQGAQTPNVPTTKSVAGEAQEAGGQEGEAAGEQAAGVAQAQSKPFDPVAWDKARADTVQASRDAGNKHLDTVPAYVETMRGYTVYDVHNPQDRGVIDTVDNSGFVYVVRKDGSRNLISPSSLMDYALTRDARLDAKALNALRNAAKKREATEAAKTEADRRAKAVAEVADLEAKAREMRPLLDRALSGTAAQQEAAQAYLDGQIDEDEFRAEVDSAPADEPAADNARDTFTVERVEDNQRSTLTFRRGEEVKVSGAYPMKSGQIEGISQANRQFKVGGVWYDFGYAYKSDYDEFAAPRREMDEYIATARKRIAEGMGFSRSDGYPIRDAREHATRYALEGYDDTLDDLEAEGQRVHNAFVEKARKEIEKADQDAQRRREEDMAREQDNTPIKMTMEEWKRIGRDFKSFNGGNRTVMHGGRIRAVEIVKEEKASNAAPAPDSIAAQHEALMDAVRTGTATPESFKAIFEKVVSGADAIKAELGAKTKAELLRIGGPYIQMRYANEKKDSVVDAVYHGMIGEYALGEAVTYGIARDSYQNAVRKMVDATDAEKLAKYVEDRKAATEEALERRKARAEALANPKTLDDFRSLMNIQIREGKTRKEAFLMLTPEQRIQYDTLEAEATRERRESRKRAAVASVRATETTTGGEIIATKHTKTGEDLFMVQPAERVERDTYDQWNAAAKRLGGRYSSYRGNGAVPGFMFRSRESAEAFVKLIGGDAGDAQQIAQQRRDAFEDDRSQTAVQRLNEMADRIEDAANEELGRDRKANTARRARFASAALNAAESQKALAKTMRNIAGAIDAGKAKFLDAVRTKTQVEMLSGLVRTAKDNELRAKYPTYAEQEKRKGERPTAETADFAEFPSFTAFRSDLATLGRQMLEVEGTKKLGQKLMSVADDVTDAYIEFAKSSLLRVSQFGRGDSLADFSNRADAERAIRRSGLTGKAIVLQVKRGQNRVILSPSEAINRKIWEGDGDKRITLSGEFGAEMVEAIGRRGSKQNGLVVPWQFQSAYDRRKALARIGIETPSEFRSALREFIGLQETAIANKVRAMELAMVGRRADGLDFFPTPAEIADQMVEAADLSPDMAVLEPSAGMGHIADRIRAAGAEPDVVEISADRRELLEEKGYHLAEANDFLNMEPRKFFTYGDVFRAPDGAEGVMSGSGGMGSDRVMLKPILPDGTVSEREGKWYSRDELTGVRYRGTGSGYDRIIMNPPFSDRRDAAHVQHAYSLLRPGGRIVAIMGEGVFFGQDKRAQEFRDWLDERGGTSEKLPEGSFTDPSLPVQTSVNARLVVIDKPAVYDGIQRSAAERPEGAGLTRATLRDAIASRFPSLADAFDAMLKRGDDGKRGGAIVVDSADPREIGRIVAERTGRNLDSTMRKFSSVGRIHGFYDPKSGLTFLVGPNLNPVTATAVLLHEVMHGQQRKKIDARALEMVRNRHDLKDEDLRAFLDRVMLRMIAAGEVGNAAEASAYLVEQAVIEGRSAGYTFADNAFMQWVDKTIGKRVGDFLRSFAGMIRTWMLRNGLGAKTMTVDDFVGYAMAGLDRAAAGEVRAGSATAASAGDSADRPASPFDPDRAWRDLISRNKLSDYDRPAEFDVTSNDDDAVSALQRQPHDFTLSKMDGGKWVALAVRETQNDDGDLMLTASLESGGYPKGSGIATKMYLSALNVARQRGIGWTSEGVRSDNALAMYARLKRAGIPFVERDGASVIDAAALAEVNLKEVAQTLLADKAGRAASGAGENFSRTNQTQTPAFRAWFGDSKVVDAEGRPLVVYHGTDSIFTEFTRTSDIGFHFGTDIAARDRAARVGGAGVLVEPVTVSRVEKDSLAALEGKIGGTPADDLYALLLRKLDNPRSDLRQQIAQMGQQEIAEAKDEYLEKPDSARFAERVERARSGEGFRVEVNGETASMHKTVREANAKAARLREQAAKPMSVFLSIQNPIRLPDLGVWPAQEIAKEAGFTRSEKDRVAIAGAASEQYAQVRSIMEGKGYDGIVYRNEVEHAGKDSYIAFRPEQIKSATGNSGTFDPENADIRFSRSGLENAQQAAKNIGDGLKAITVQDVKKAGKHKLTDWLKLGLQFLGRRQLVDIYDGVIPLSDYDRLAAQMEADKNDVGAEADDLARRWGKLPDEGKLADLMHDATLAQIDADSDVAYADGDDRAKSSMLKAQFKALTPEAKKVYREARDQYRKHHAAVRQAIIDRIMRSELREERRAELLKRMDADFFKAIKGVYFPLSRFGQYVVVTKDSTGKVASVSRAETMAEADAMRAEMLKAFPAKDGYQVGRVILSKEFVASRDMVGRGFMTELYEALDKQGLPASVMAELEDTLGQLYLTSLPDLSWAKHGIHRKGTPGFSNDARRAFAQNTFHGARYLAKLKYGDQMLAELERMQEHVDKMAPVENFDQPAAQRVVDEMNKRHEAMMNPKSNPLSTALTSFGFVYYLGISPAAAIVNLSQTPLVAYPVLGAKWGFRKAGAALLRASKETMEGKNDLRAKLTDKDEIAAYDEAVRTGVIDVTRAHDLAGIAQGEDAKVMWKMRPVMRLASSLFHHAERFNRQATFLAAYRLARDAGAKHDTAYSQAVKATYDGHFDYSAGNRPRIMQGNVAKVVLLFKQYAQNMIYTIGRNAYQAVAGESPEVRKEARKMFAALMTTHAAAAGVLGLPMVGTLLAVASALGGSDDEPWDAEIALRNMLADAFGPTASEVIAKGFSRLTPWDISGRVGLDKLLLPDVNESLEGQRWAESFSTAMLGPVIGIGVNAAKGAQKMADGDYGRGLEDMLPVFARNPVKAFRQYSEGEVDRTGVVIKDDVSMFGVLGQASGFSPSEIRLAFEGRSAVMSADRRLAERRQELMTQFARSAMDQDQEGMAEARQAIAKFNEANPGRRITAPQMWQSVRNRQRRIREAEDGVYLPRTRRDVADEGRFAVGA